MSSPPSSAATSADPPAPVDVRPSAVGSGSTRFKPWQAWLWLGLAFLGLWLLLGLWLRNERQVARAHEGEKLQSLVQTLDGIVSQQLIAIQAALQTVDAEYPRWRAAQKQADGESLLQTLTRAMPGVRLLLVVDANGRVQASSMPELLGRDVSDRPYFIQSQRRPQEGLLHVTPPYQTLLDDRSVAVARTLHDAEGHYQGVIVAGLDPGYFSLVLATVQPSEDTWAAIAHESGAMFAVQPQVEAWIGRNVLDQPGSVLEHHLRSQRLSSLHLQKSRLSHDLRLVAARTVAPESLWLDQRLYVAVGRSMASVEGLWRRQVFSTLLGGAILTLLAPLGLYLYQRRRRLVEQLRSQQRRTERDSAARTALALEGAALGLWDWNLVTGETRFDQRWCTMLGHVPHEIEGHVKAWEDRLHPDDSPIVREHLQRYLSGELTHYTQDYRLRHRDGHWVWIHANGRIMARDAQRRPTRMVGTHMDISATKRAEALLQAQAQHTQAILDNMVDGMITMDTKGRIDAINPAACRMFGYSAEELVGQRVELLMPEGERPHHAGHVRRYLETQVPHVIGIGRDVNGRRKDGSIFPMSLAVSEILQDGEPLFIGLTRDITERKKAEAEIEQLAFYDSLTGLPNRRLLLDRLNQALAINRRNHRHGAVLFIDLDNFKALNDTLGHGMGDRVLVGVARRLQAALRSEDTIARWGGDEFVVVLHDLGQNAQVAALHAEAAAEKLLRVLGQPHQLDGHQHHSTPSIGIVIWGGDTGSSEDLLKHADHAMYQAKAAGRNRLCFFDPATQAAMAELTALEADLRQAINCQQLELFYQAQVDERGNVVGAEALLRWNHPVQGWISPARFIPLAEHTGLIAQLGEWVLQQACAQLGLWAREPHMAALTLAVNVSAHQFRQKGFLGFMQQLLARSGAPTDKLKLEITESALVENVEQVIALMVALRSLGLHFSLDDFGTGYSSLAYLKRLPLDQLKIDQSFVRDLVTEPNAMAIARAVIQLGESLGLDVIAEGVETEAQREALRQQGCHGFQGYLYARPLALQDFEALVQGWPASPAHS
ncbi:bifunctional diguanylate cyclase/phosphodiesterase [Roseateles sp. DB2]|uniref:bifunctional diguanylate cyclase/phosphodiesterase n=1 Tax=Roseateles sp. DB2 TaxID=3453717 RepID=UPI003EEC5D75